MFRILIFLLFSSQEIKDDVPALLGELQITMKELVELVRKFANFGFVPNPNLKFCPNFVLHLSIRGLPKVNFFVGQILLTVDVLYDSMEVNRLRRFPLSE